MIFVTGGSGSGKSAYAERLAVETGADELFYVATMSPEGAEAKERIAHHRAMRAGKGFRTVECMQGLERLVLPGGEFRENDVARRTVLLECVSNLVANEQFAVGGTDGEILARIEKGIRHLQKQAGNIIIVTNDVFADGVRYDEETERYLRLLAAVNRGLAAQADAAYEVVYGIPVPIKTGLGSDDGFREG